jgi:cyanophycin synthetase
LVHPEVARIAVLAAKTVGLNIAGIDMMLTDVSQPPQQQRGAVLEVNASPSLIMHVKPVRGEAQPVGEAIVDQLFTPGKDGRIPIVAVSGTNGKSSVIALLKGLLTAHYDPQSLAVASSDGLFVGERALVNGVATDYENVERLLVNPLVDLALVEMEPRTILTQGIAFDHCQVAVVTNFGSSDHLGVPLMDRERMLLVERCGVDMVLPEGTAVLNADDADVLAMAPKCCGKLLLFSRDAAKPALMSHRDQGGRTVALKGTLLSFEEGERCLVEAELPAGLIGDDVENLLAALGAGWALGLSPSELILRATRVFESNGDASMKARRTRHFERDGRRVFVSSARNPSAYESVLSTVEQGSFARRIAIQTYFPKDWRCEDAFMVGSLLGTRFDEVRLREESSLAVKNVDANGSRNGQPEPSLVAAFVEGVLSQKHAVLSRIHDTGETFEALSLSSTERGDLLFVQVAPTELAASFSLREEEASSASCSSATSRTHRLDGSQVEM